VVRTGEDQPSPLAMRTAVRDVVRHCIYGVDLNPLAVELCKVALWLEAHVPGEPLSFLNHHIKCGNAIVGYVRREDVESRGVPDEAFEMMPGDDKEVAALLRKHNKSERAGQKALKFDPEVERQLDEALKGWKGLDRLPEHTPEQVEAKRKRFESLSKSAEALWMEQLAAIPIAQFYIPKVKNRPGMHVTEEEFRSYWKGARKPQSQATAEAWAIAERKRFFHWFLAFPEVISAGGFDCILGNPPYLGGKKIRDAYGDRFCGLITWLFEPIGLSDLVVFFLRRIHSLLNPNGIAAFITTNSIKDGGVREDGLDAIIRQRAQVIMAIRAVRWPGRAKLFVSLISFAKQESQYTRYLDGVVVKNISSLLEDEDNLTPPTNLLAQSGRGYIGSVLYADAFFVAHSVRQAMIAADPRNADVVRPILNGDEANSSPEQSPSRSVICFRNFALDVARSYVAPFAYAETSIKAERQKYAVRGGAANLRLAERWWLFGRYSVDMYRSIAAKPRCFAAAITTKHLAFSSYRTDQIFTNALFVVDTDRWDHFAVLQSGLHESWARYYSSALKQDLRYSPSNCFETFPFPGDLWQTANPALVQVGEEYHEHRRRLMRELWLGLTPIYNLYHARDLTSELVAKVSKMSADAAHAGFKGLLELRRLHVALDNAVRDAYGWTDLNLGHDFVEVETLSENDRVRYTINPLARKEVLKRLLALNHARAGEEVAQAQATENGQAKRTPAKRAGKATPPSAPVGVPAFETVSAGVAALPGAAWASAGEEPATNDTLALAAVLKAFAVPAATQHARLAAVLCAEPRLFARLAPQPLAAQWQRLVGNQAAALPSGVSVLAPTARTSFGVAVRTMRARGVLVEDMILDTWGPGPGLDVYDTSGWPEGRARWLVSWLKSQDLGALLQGLPTELASFINEQAA
jgi:hypothetical protein